MGTRHTLVEDEDRLVRLEAIPIQAPAIDERLALMVINSWAKSDVEHMSAQPAGVGLQMTDDHLRELDQELATTREALQQTIEELETSNEELQALNEELQSTNEELQATNEELETSNEELQSTNEELITVNEELQVNSSELMGLNAELASLLGNVPVPLLVLDNALQIARASHTAMKLFNIAEPLRNPHLSQIHLPDGFPRLVEFCNEALRLGEPVNNDFTTESGPYTLQCAPFSGDGGQIIGTTLVFLRSPPAIQSLANELHQLLSNAPVYLLQHDEGGLVTRVSSRMAELLGMSPENVTGMSVEKLLDVAMIAEDSGLRDLLAGKPHDGAFELIGPNGETVWLAALRHAYTDPSTGQMVVVILGNDVTEIVQASAKAKQSDLWLHSMEDIAETGYWRVDLANGEVDWSDRVYKIHGEDPKTYTPNVETGIDAYHPEDQQLARASMEQTVKSFDPFDFQCRLIHKSGTTIWVRSVGVANAGADGNANAIVGSFRDITHEVGTTRRMAELERLVGREQIGFISFDLMTKEAYWSPSTYRILKLDPEKGGGGYEMLRSLFAPAEQRRLDKNRDRAIESGKPYVDKFKFTNGEGQRGVLQLDITVIKRDDGVLTNYFGSITILSMDET